MLNTKTYLSFIGTAIYAYEGIGIVIPIMDETKDKLFFSKLCFIVITFVTFLYVFFGLINYFTFGPSVLTDCPLITKCLPSNNIIISITMFLWILNIFITYPLCLYPANMIIESYLYKGWSDSSKKFWCVNCSRTILVALTVFLGVYFTTTLDRLMSVVGSLTCSPIAFIFPAGYHLALTAKSKFQKVTDLLIMILGCIFMVFGTAYTIYTWSEN